MKEVVYKDCVLAKGSRALELWEEWQKAKSDRNQKQKALDNHMKEVDQKERDLLTRYRQPTEVEELSNYLKDKLK